MLKALQHENISVPDEMALVGFDDFDWADLLAPRLSLIAQPIKEIGGESVALLFNRIENPDSDIQLIQTPPN